MKKVITILGLFGLIIVQAQVGINQDAPKATLDIKAEKTDGTQVEGLLVPRISKEAAYNMAIATTTPKPQESNLVYVNNANYAFPVGATDAQKATVADITEKGYYFWNGIKWVKTVGEQGAEWGYKSGVNRVVLKRNIDVEVNGITIGVGSGTSSNTVIGNGSLENGIDSGSNHDNTAIGYKALNKSTDAHANTAIGAYALSKSTTGEQSVAVGAYALHNNISGFYNVALGAYSLATNTTGKFNVAVGNAVLNNLNGSYNTGLGTNALNSQISGSDNIGIGYNVQLPNLNGSNQLNIGNTIYGLSIGGANSKIGIGTTAPTEKLEVNGNIKLQDTVGTALIDGTACDNPGTISYSGGSFFGCTGGNLWKKLHN